MSCIMVISCTIVTTESGANMFRPETKNGARKGQEHEEFLIFHHLVLTRRGVLTLGSVIPISAGCSEQLVLIMFHFKHLVSKFFLHSD